MDRNKFANALIRVLPKLEKDSNAISLAYSDVLRQMPVHLRQKEGGITDRSFASTTKPVRFNLS